MRNLRYRFSLRICWPYLWKAHETEDDRSGSNINLVQYPLKRTSFSPKWTDFDLDMLSIRDFYMRDFFKRSFAEDALDPAEVVPMYEIIHGLVEQRYQDASFPATYYCFSEISQQALRPRFSPGMFTNVDELCRQSAYLHDLVKSRCGALLLKWVTAQVAPSSNQSYTSDFRTLVKVGLFLYTNRIWNHSYHITRTVASPPWRWSSGFEFVPRQGCRSPRGSTARSSEMPQIHF